MKELAIAVSKAARAVCDDSGPGTDAAGGSVNCVTSAIMGITAGLFAVSYSLKDIADAIREHGGANE